MWTNEELLDYHTRLLWYLLGVVAVVLIVMIYCYTYEREAIEASDSKMEMDGEQKKEKNQVPQKPFIHSI